MNDNPGTLHLPPEAIAAIERTRRAEPQPAPAQRLADLRSTARTIKLTVVIDGAPLSGLIVPNGQGKVSLKIDVAERVLRASLSAKSTRKAVAAIDADGPGAVAVVLSGRLEADDSLADAGIIVQARSPKRPPAEVTA